MDGLLEFFGYQKPSDVFDKIKQKEERENIHREVPIIGKMTTSEEKEIKLYYDRGDRNLAQLKEFRSNRKKAEQTQEGLKLVIDEASLLCNLCTEPEGILKVLLDTPSTQEKKTATVVEKSPNSLVFKGNCKNSPQSSSPCASVMNLGDWEEVGALKVQDQFPLLQKSTILCKYGGVKITITDSAQIQEPTVKLGGVPLPKNNSIE